MSAHDEAERFYEQLRASTIEQVGPAVDFPWPGAVEMINQTLAQMRPADARDPWVRRSLEQTAGRLMAGDTDAVFSELLTRLQDDIETTATESLREGADITRRPLVRHMTTGQLNAVSLRVPSEADVYLILVEDQMQTFVFELCRVVALAVPSERRDVRGRVGFRFDALEIADHVANRNDIVGSFASIVVTYAATGKVGLPVDLAQSLSGARSNLSDHLQRAFYYFVLGHEYGHVLLGHLDTAASNRGVLPFSDAEALVHSWKDEIEADFLGAVLGIQASVNLGGIQPELAYMGMSLFFDAIEIMDRAVALLETGDDEELQLGSHPPAKLRKQRLRESLAAMPPLQPERSLKLADAEGAILCHLWQRIRPALVELRQRGGRASRTWQVVPRES